MTKKVAVYVRCSTKNNIQGAESQEYAILTQLRAEGVGKEEIAIYKDLAISGATESRPRLDDLMEDIKNGKISAVVVFSFSRWARSLNFLLRSLDMLSSYDVSFRSLTENCNTDEPVGKFVMSLLGSVSELERSLIRDRVVSGLNRARAKGIRLGRPRVYSREKVLALHKEGLSRKKISMLIGCNIATVGRILHKSINAQNPVET